MLSLLFSLPIALVLMSPPPMAVVQYAAMSSAAVVELQTSGVFPNGPTTLLALSPKEKIEAAKAATALKQESRGVMTAEAAPIGATTGGQVVAKSSKCPDDDTLLSQGSGKSGNMVSKACSAQLGQRRAKAAKEAAEVKRLAIAKANAQANGGLPSLPSLPKLF